MSERIAGYNANARSRGRRGKRAGRRANRILERAGNGTLTSPTSRRSIYRAELEADRYIRDAERASANRSNTNEEQPSGGDSTNS